MAGLNFLFGFGAKRFYKKIDSPLHLDEPSIRTPFVRQVRQLLGRIFRVISNLFTFLFKKRRQRQSVAADSERGISNASYRRIHCHMRHGDLITNQNTSLLVNQLPDDLSELFEVDIPEENPLGNTILTEYLASLAFDLDVYKDKRSELLNKLSYLTSIAAKKTKAPNLTAKASIQLLQQANQATPLGQRLIVDGIPSNTPLMLLSKMGEETGAVTIIPFYDREHLLHANDRGNTALHFAALTGQLQTVKAILERAQSLGILKQVLTAKNNVGYSGADIYHKIIKINMSRETRRLLHKNILDFADEHLGGEEINKANIGKYALTQTTRNSVKFAKSQGLADLSLFKGDNVLKVSAEQFLLNCCLLSFLPHSDLCEPQAAIS